MAVKSTTEIKATLRSEISIYVGRRDKAKAAYLKYAKRLNCKLSTWRRQLKRIEAWERKLVDIDNFIKEFTGCSAKASIYAQNKNKILAKQLMCRYALERGISGKFVRDFIGGKGQWTVGKNRMRFIRRCQANNELKNTWKNFLNSINEHN